MASVQKKRLLFIGSTLFISFLLTMIIILNFYFKSIVEHQIETFLNANKKEYYSVHFEKLQLNWLTHTIILKGVKVSPDSTLLSKVMQDSTAKTAFYITLKSLRIRHVNILDAINKNKIDIQEIDFQKPVLTYFSHLKRDIKRNPNQFEKRSSFSYDSLFLKGIQGVSIGNIDLSHAQVHFVFLNGTTAKTGFEIKNLSLHLSGISVLPIQKGSSIFKLTVDNYHIKASDQFVPIAGNRYKLRFESIAIDKEKKLIIVRGLQLKPIKKWHKRLSRNHFKKNLFDVEVNEMKLKALDLNALFFYRTLFARRIDIVGASIKIVNKKYSAGFKKKKPLFPNQMLNRLSIPITIDTLYLVNSFLEYLSLKKGTEVPLKLQFSKINAEIHPLTSVKKNHHRNAHFTAEVHAKLMKKIPINIHLTFPSNRSLQSFTFWGSMGSGSFLLFNKLSKRAGLVFKGGRINSLQFRGVGNSTYAYGKLLLKYQNLKVNILKNNSYKKKGFLSWAANSILRTENPVNGYDREATIYYQRLLYEGFPAFFWKSIFSGIKATLIPGVEKANNKAVDQLQGVSKKKRRKYQAQKKKKKRKAIRLFKKEK